MKKVMFLVDDYWHSEDTIRPLVEILFDKNNWNIIFTKDPLELYENKDVDLFLSFKDPIENDQIPTPIWCDEKWTDMFMELVSKGMGVVAVHAQVTDLEETHPIVKEIIHSVFLTHPEQCELSVKILKKHPVTEGVEDFVFPEFDEHYQMSMLDGNIVELLANTVSKNGTQPGLWVSEYENGRICCFTPGHTTANLTCDGYVKILKNAIGWTVKEI